MTRRPASGVGRHLRKRVRPAYAGAVLTLLLILAAPELRAQIWGATPQRDTVRLRPELRLDYLDGNRHAVHGGVGMSLPAGTYVRLGGVVGGGPGWGAFGPLASARVDLTARFLIDPFRRSRWGTSIGGGISGRYDDDRLRTFALVLVDVEGPGRTGWIPFFSGGLGGGGRLAAGVRRAATAGR